jgi:anthranilate phosphoribosyltransferase
MPRIQQATEQMIAGQALARGQAAGVMDEIMAGEATPVQVAGFLVALRMKGETVEEMVGLVESMRAHATVVSLDGPVVDTCGTGGDRQGTFNISTAAALVVAGAGGRVAKHGNRAASSRCGSADVLEALGVAIALGPEAVRRCVDEVGFAFLFAPTFHPAMRHAAATRRELGIRTIFNVLGPLASPAQVRRQSVGVGDASLAPKMAEVLQRLGHQRALVFHGEDGLDELTTTEASVVYDVTPDGVRHYRLDPQDLGIARSRLEDLMGGDPRHNARLLAGAISGQRGPHRDIVALNAAAALIALGRAPDWKPALQAASDAIDSGAATRCLERLVALTQRLAKEG